MATSDVTNGAAATSAVGVVSAASDGGARKSKSGKKTAMLIKDLLANGAVKLDNNLIKPTMRA